MRAWLALATALVGCYAPNPAVGIPCGDGACPTPLVCSPATLTCEISATHLEDAGADSATDGSVVDMAPPDATLCSGHDEDGDGIPDGCDNCPTLANLDQADTTEPIPDGVGDLCDPHPTAKDRIALFEGFAELPTGWSIASGATVSGDRLHVLGLTGYDSALTPLVSSNGVLVTRYQVDAVRAHAFHSVEVLSVRGDTGVKAYRCMTIDSNTANSRSTAIQTFVSPYDVVLGATSTASFAAGTAGTLRFEFGPQLDCRPSSPPDPVNHVAPETRTGLFGVGVQYVDTSFDYVILYEPVP